MNIWPVGSIVVNRYEIREKVDIGTLTELRLAFDRVLRRNVILKLINHKISTDFNQIELFQKEAFLAASVEHPNILPVHDFGADGDYYYLVMRPFDMTFSHLLNHRDDYPTFDTHAMLKVLRALADVIDALHIEYNIIHRNIKPNVVTIKHESSWYPYLWDFGVAAIGQAGVGTPVYMAPEQFTSNNVTHTIDNYAFGILIFQCFTDKFPFSKPDNLIDEKLNPDEQLYSVRRYQPELPIGIDLVLRRLCAKNPDDRYQTASEAVDDLYRVFYSGQGNIEGKVFISYATKDKDYVHKFAAELLSIGIDVWIDLNIHQGTDWGDSIEEALKVCDMMLLVTTESSMNSFYVSHEWSYFMGLGKPVYPFVPDTKLPDNIHPRLNRLQLVQGTGDILADIQNVVTVLAGGNPKKLGGLDE